MTTPDKVRQVVPPQMSQKDIEIARVAQSALWNLSITLGLQQ